MSLHPMPIEVELDEHHALLLMGGRIVRSYERHAVYDPDIEDYRAADDGEMLDEVNFDVVMAFQRLMLMEGA